MKNYIYRVTCTDDRGWGLGGADALWGDLAAPESRLFATAAEAKAAMRRTLNSCGWSYENSDGEWEDDPPVFDVERMAVHEFLWGDHSTAVLNRVVALHGGPVALDAMPNGVIRFLLQKYTRAEHIWSLESARLAGASSATHTAAFIAARFAARVKTLSELARSRGIEGIDA